MRRAARSSSTSVTAGARSPRRWPNRPVGSRTPTAAPSRRSRSSATRRASAAHLPLDGAGDLSGLRRVRGDRDRAQARPRLPPRPRRDGSLDRDRRGGGATTATRSGPWTCPGGSRCAGRTGLARAVPARLRGVPLSRRRPGRERPRRPATNWPRSWRRPSRRPAPARSRRSSPSRSSARPWRRRSRPTTTGRRSPRSVAATAYCSSPTRS